MEELREAMFNSVLGTVFRVSRLAGAAPFTFTQGGPIISRCLTLYSYILVTFINVVVLAGFAIDLLTEPSLSLRVSTPTSRLVWIANLSIVILITSVSVYQGPSRIACNINTLKQIIKVWSRFQATQKDGSIIKLRIQDLPWEQHKDNLAEFYMKYFIKDEAFHRAAGIFNNEEAETEYREIVFSYYEKKELHVSICCLDDDSNTNDILGMSLVMELNKSQSEDNVDGFKPKTKEVQNLFHIISLIHDIKPSKGYEKYYEGRGIIVRPDLRGLGIANEFVRLRKQICIDNNIQMSSAWMTSIGTQKAAAKNNWETFMELSVEEFETRTGLLFEADTPVFKLMYTTKE